LVLGIGYWVLDIEYLIPNIQYPHKGQNTPPEKLAVEAPGWRALNAKKATPATARVAALALL
jgi:hypothetical protein